MSTANPVALPSQAENFLTIEDLSGGRNGSANPISLAPTEVVEARNTDTWRTTLARKRGGSAAGPYAGITATVGSFYDSLYRHVPNAQDQTAELWLVATDGTINRMAGGTSWTVPASVDPFNGIALATQWASVHNKLFVSNQFHVDHMGNLRQHVWDPTANAGAGLIRRSGITPSVLAPMVGDSGSGTYAAVARYYRVRWIEERYIANGVNQFGYGPTLNPALITAPLTIVTLNQGAGLVTTFTQTFDSGVAPLSTANLTVSANVNVIVYAAAGGRVLRAASPSRS